MPTDKEIIATLIEKLKYKDEQFKKEREEKKALQQKLTKNIQDKAEMCEKKKGSDLNTSKTISQTYM